MSSLIHDPELLQRAVGWNRSVATDAQQRRGLRSYLAFQLASAGLPVPPSGKDDDDLATLSDGIFETLREKNRLLSDHRAPVDARIESFLADYFQSFTDGEPLRLPDRSLVLDRHGMARELSLPVDGHHFQSDLVESYRCGNGVLNNPVADRRTTAGTFHVVAGGLPIADDKRVVPEGVFVKLFRAAMQPPEHLMKLPYLSQSDGDTGTWVSLLLRPLVRPEVGDVCKHQSFETRFFAPGSLVSNLDFVESIFGNAGDPLIAANDAGLDAEHWSGHTGCVILATHLTRMKKKDLGLPHYDDATERQRRDSMCWKDEDEFYNDGTAFKLTCRGPQGVVVTIIADNYYGYCKKEVKTQISYAANLMGGVEEEHAGGATAFASYSLGETFKVDSRRYNNRCFADVARDYADSIDVRPEGYGIDKIDPSVIYIPEDAFATLHERCIRWEQDGQTHRIPLSPDQVYIAPSGYKIQLEKHPNAPSWRLIGTVGEGIFCHKPCTVSGGGKSEISKSLRDYMIYGPIFVSDPEKDFAKLDEIFSRDYGDRWRTDTDDKPDYQGRPSRSVLDPGRSLGSTIQLLTPQPNFSDEYVQWLGTIPNHVYAMALIIKRFIAPGMEENWREYFGVDTLNGAPGHELKMGDRPLVGTYLRVGMDDAAGGQSSRWRTFKLRQDFIAAAKVQREDDISCSTVIPASQLNDVGPNVMPTRSYKFVENCEYRLFQRPDDAIHRGLDKQTEWDLSRDGNFISNFAPLTTEDAREIRRDAIEFDKFTGPMEQLLDEAAAKDDGYIVSTAHPRVMKDGRVTSNPRYLQDRPDLVNARDTYVARRGIQLHRSLGADDPVHVPVGAVLSGRRNNPPDREAGIRSLAVYSPLHYQELPELVMDYVCSLTGKSPSTTGAGSEGALTKAPFNCLQPAIDLNAMIVSMILTELGGFSTAAGHIGPQFEVGHDVSLLIPEVWCRMTPEERDPKRMIQSGMLEAIEDFEHNGVHIAASRLGYRITPKFARTYLGRVFDNPVKVFPESILRPETQDLESFADGVLQITEAQTRVARRYFEDGGYEMASPPLRAVLSIMAEGSYEGKTLRDPEVRELFTIDSMLQSDWYGRRLQAKASRDVLHWERFVDRLKAASAKAETKVAEELRLSERLKHAEEQLERSRREDYVDSLVGTIGLDPMAPATNDPSMLDKLAAATSFA